MRFPRDREEEERERYHGDVIYGVWSRGGNPDRVSHYRTDDYRDRGYDASEAADIILRQERAAREAARAAAEEEERRWSEEWERHCAEQEEAYERMCAEEYVEHLRQQEVERLPSAEGDKGGLSRDTDRD